MTDSTFRDFVYAPDEPRVSEIRGLDARQYAEAVKSDSFAGPMIVGWAQLYPEPYVGITSDGVVQKGLYPLGPVPAGHAAPTEAMFAAARTFLALLDPAAAEKVSYTVDAHEWRTWANPEFMQHDTGLRLDEVDPSVRDALLAVVESSLSPEGYSLVRSLMRINGFLGDVVELPLLMNEFSYNFALYGEPSLTAPWGWQLFGHHVALNCLVVGEQMVISPVFLGAEPDTIDEGEFAGVRVFGSRIATARELMAGLPAEQRKRAVIYAEMVDPAMPPDRLHSGDERHLGGCFQDNRVVPYEGIRVAEMPVMQQVQITAILEDFVGYLPDGPARVRMSEITSHYENTWFSWIGGWEGSEPFYFRIQSPVVMAELDHHSGVFLKNEEPAAFHMHTVLRTPNANDYGRALVEAALGRPLAP